MAEPETKLPKSKAGLQPTPELTQQEVAELRAIEEVWKGILELSTDAILIIQKEGRIETVNHVAAEYLGRGEGELAGRNYFELLGNDRRRLYEENIERAFTSGTLSQWESQWNQEFFQNMAIPVADRSRCALISKNITAKKLAEESAQNKRARLSTLIETLPDMIWLKDTDGRYVNCNHKFERFLGAKEAEIKGKTEANFLPNDQAKRFREDAAKTLQQNQTMVSQTWIEFANDGHKEFVEVIHTPFVDSLGTLKGVMGIARNVTAFKQNEEALAYQSSLYKTQLDMSLDGILVVDEHGDILDYNQKFLDMWDLSPPAIKSIPDLKLVSMVLDKVQDPAGFAARINQLYASVHELGFDEINLRNGKTLERYSASIIAPDKEYRGRIWYFRDCSSRKQAEHTLKLFRSSVEHASEAILWCRRDAHYIFANHEACRQLGYTPEEFRQLRPWNIDLNVSPETWHERWVANWNLPTTGRYTERIHRRKDGSLFPVEILVYRLEFQEEQVYVVTCRDITVRKQAEAQIQQQAELLEASHDAIIVWDMQHGVQYMNPAAEKLTGQTFGEAKSQALSFILRTRSSLSLTAAVLEVTTHGKWTEELSLLSSEGKSRDVATRWVALKNAQGNSTLVLITCNDITEQKQLQAQYLRAQRLDSVGTLASGVAHDLNNILSPILMGVDLLEMVVTDAEMLDTIAMMKESARRGSDTVRQLLTFARGADSQKGPVQPRHLLKEITRLIQQTFPKNIQIYSDFTGQPTTVLADPSQLHQVLMNLCVNARDAMPQGGVLFLRLEHITLSASTAKLHPKARPIAYVVFKISDSGMGIPPENIDRIFDPFFTTKPQGQGTGLGLSTVLGIVENHDGFVQVESQQGQGTTFQIFLPACASAAEPIAPTEESVVRRGRGECVLVVDDEPAIVRTAESVLRKAGYQTMSAGNASEAIHVYERNQDRIHAVITDIMMPFGDGRQLIMLLYEQDPKLPIIAMSGVSSPQFQHDLSQRGACQFLSKPFSAEQLLASLAKALQLSARPKSS